MDFLSVFDALENKTFPRRPVEKRNGREGGSLSSFGLAF
jgi:hypothetical protein